MPDHKIRPYSSTAAERAFMEKLYKEHRALMYHTALSVTGSADMSDEIVSDSFIYLMGKAKVLMSLEKNALLGYIAVTVRNTAYGCLNRRRRSAEMTMPDIPEELPDDSEDILDGLIVRETNSALRECLKKLPRDDMDLLFMKYVQELKNAEIAGILGIKDAAVRKRLSRMRFRLADMMKGAESDGK